MSWRSALLRWKEIRNDTTGTTQLRPKDDDTLP